jgi:hypothetical protein
MEREEITKLYDECTGSLYLKKYQIEPLLLDRSLSLKLFFVLIYQIKHDVDNENVEISFDFCIDRKWGREYVRYSLNVKGTFFTHTLFYQVQMMPYNYREGKLFTVLNIYEEVVGFNDVLQAKKASNLIDELAIWYAGKNNG